jgi:hypothetical protein
MDFQQSNCVEWRTAALSHHHSDILTELLLVRLLMRNMQRNFKEA